MDTQKTRLATIGYLSFLMVALLAGCAVTPENSDDMNDELIIEVEGDSAYLSGVLTSNLVERLTELIKSSPNVNEIVLVDVPGAIDQQATMEGALLFRRLGINTRIASTGLVLSGGVALFLGGVERSIGAGAGVGMHAWTDGTEVKATSINVGDPIHATYVNS